MTTDPLNVEADGDAVSWFRERHIPEPRAVAVLAIKTALAGFDVEVDDMQALHVWEAATDVADHTWLNAFKCVRPTDDFAADVGRSVIAKVMEARHRNVCLTFNAS